MGRLRSYKLEPGSSLMGRFERRRVVASITPRNWRTKGVVFWSDGQLVYVSIMSWREGDEKGFAVRSVAYRHGAWSFFGRETDSYKELNDAITAVNARKAAADAAVGAVAWEDLPPDTEAATVVLSPGPRLYRG